MFGLFIVDKNIKKFFLGMYRRYFFFSWFWYFFTFWKIWGWGGGRRKWRRKTNRKKW